MLAAVPELDTLVVPIGGGGLISGIAVAAKAIKPSIEIVGVEADLYPSMLNRIDGGERPCRGDTLAEGIAVKSPGMLTEPVIRALVSEILLVSEVELESAVTLLIEIEKTVVEGRGRRWPRGDAAAPRAVQGPQGRPRAVRRQYRYAPAGRRADPRAGARRPPVGVGDRPARPPGPARPAHRRASRPRPAPTSSRSCISACSPTCPRNRLPPASSSRPATSPTATRPSNVSEPQASPSPFLPAASRHES